MKFNSINLIQNCFDSIQEIGLTSLVYYSHIPIIIASLLLGFFIFSKNKGITSKIILAITFIFSLWLIIDIFLWTSLNSQTYVFLWSLIVFIEVIIFILGIYLIISFATNKDVSSNLKLFWGLLLLPILILMPTIYNIGYFDKTECLPIDGLLYQNYTLYAMLFLFFWFIVTFFYLLRKIKKEKIKSFKIIFSGLFLFLFAFISSNFLIYYLVENDILSFVDAYKIEMYSLFIFPVFLIALTFIIVRFKAFNIKLLGAQALVWALIILVGAQFIYLNDMPVYSMILTSITLILSAIIGLLVVRSVKKIDQQKELLIQANQNQQSLLHFITHQVKAYMTKSRNIFDGMVQGDYGELSDKSKEMANYGFESETRAVETVQAILRASDLKSGRTEFKKEKTNISALVAEAIEIRQDQATAKGLEFTFDIEPNIEVLVDPIQIKEAFKNMITNAVIYTTKGSVHVELKREDNKVRFTIIDTGFGLTAEDKTKLFKEGGKSMDSLLVNVESTGYGLYIAKQIVHKHGGIIGAKSKGRNQGSEFFVILPIMN